jgi:hypothetical protein
MAAVSESSTASYGGGDNKSVLKEVKSGLAQAARDHQFDSAVQRCGGHIHGSKRGGRSADETVDVRALLLGFSTKESETLCSKLNEYARWCLKRLEVIEEEGEISVEVDEEVVPELFVARLRGVAAIAMAYSMEDLGSKPNSLLNLVEALHEALIPLDEIINGVSQLKSAIAKICEHWWLTDEAGAENLIPQLLPYLLISSLNPESPESDIKRVYHIRLSLHLLDFDDESIDSVKSLLLRCFMHPRYLKVTEGRKFLAFLFSICKSSCSLKYYLPGSFNNGCSEQAFTDKLPRYSSPSLS